MEEQNNRKCLRMYKSLFKKILKIFALRQAIHNTVIFLVVYIKINKFFPHIIIYA